MRVESIRTLPGPNVHTHRPALVMRLDLEDLAGRESRELEGFNERLLALLPGLRAHHCSKGYEGGFLERLREGTYFGHVVEHAALELMNLAGVGVMHGRTRGAEAPGVYQVVVEYKAEQATRYLLSESVALVGAVVRGEEFPVGERVAEARRVAARTELGPSTRAIVEAAERRNIPAMRLGTDSIVQLGWGRHRRFVQAATTDRTSSVSVEIACDKDLTKQILEAASIPVPRGRTVGTEDEAAAALADLGGRVVVKPLDGRQGLGVSLDLSDAEEVRRAFRIARDYSASVLVEELLKGRNYRVLVVDGRVVAASERVPCHVVGDGVSTAAELIEAANLDPLRSEGHEKPLTKIVVDEIVLAHLEKRGRTLRDVPAEGEVFTLRDSVNLSTGGVAKDVTDRVHPEVAFMCERAARAVGLDVCGVDLVLEDISAAPARGGGVIELNASPGLRMHHYPSEGEARDAGAAVVASLFPEGDGRVPLVSVTGTNGKTTVTRMIAHVFQTAGVCVGVTTTDGIWVGGRRTASGDTTGPHSARAVLSDPTVEMAVLETARGGIARRGLGYDWSDVAVLTNIQPDHFGHDGIESLEDLLFVKSLVAERVREGGTLVLNADDEHLARLAESRLVRRTPKRVVYFSLREDHARIRKHRDAGGTAYFVRGGWVVEAEGLGGERQVVEVTSVPATMGGAAPFQIANVLVAVAACRARGAEPAQIARALAGFNVAADNPGRLNLYRLPSGGHVLLDYGHNPEAFAAVCQMAARWQGRTVTGIVGVPGDRSDALVEEAARVAARGFRRVVIREGKDLRGRRPGEVAGIIRRAVLAESPGAECRVVADETEALRGELLRAGPADIVVVFYEKLAPLVRLLEEFGGEPVSGAEGIPPQAEAAAAFAQYAFNARAYNRPADAVAYTAPEARPAADRQGHIRR